jgi:hypothetical protein
MALQCSRRPYGPGAMTLEIIKLIIKLAVVGEPYIGPRIIRYRRSIRIRWR